MRKTRILGLLLFLVSLPLAQADTPAPRYRLGDSETFWVWDLSVMPPAFRRATAQVRSIGPRSYIFVEEKLWERNITSDYVQELHDQLEILAPKSRSAEGIIPFQERIFAPLPKVMRDDERVIVLFADLGKYKNFEFDGFFNAFDQMSEEEARKSEQHSNEANIIYINGFRGSKDYTTGVISHELQHLISHHLVKEPNFYQDLWLSETIAEGAMLMTGFYTDQGHVDRYANNTANYPLVSHTYVQYGPQLLFSSYLFDTIRKNGGLGYLARQAVKGREAIEKLFRNRADAPLSFDAIFSSFINYIFESSTSHKRIPFTWEHTEASGLQVPYIKPYATIPSYPAEVESSVYPYAFALYELEQELPASALVRVEALRESSQAPVDQPPQEPSCANTATPLWKPVTPRYLAVYAVGCEHKSQKDIVKFRLSIFDKPSLFPQGALTILPNAR